MRVCVLIYLCCLSVPTLDPSLSCSQLPSCMRHPDHTPIKFTSLHVTISPPVSDFIALNILKYSPLYHSSLQHALPVICLSAISQVPTFTWLITSYKLPSDVDSLNISSYPPFQKRLCYQPQTYLSRLEKDRLLSIIFHPADPRSMFQALLQKNLDPSSCNHENHRRIPISTFWLNFVPTTTVSTT